MTDPATSPQGATEEESVDQRGKAARSVKRDYEAGNGDHLPPVFGGTAPLITVQPAVWVNVIASRYRETKDSENYPPRLMKKMITTTSRRAAKKSPSIAKGPAALGEGFPRRISNLRGPPGP